MSRLRKCITYEQRTTRRADDDACGEEVLYPEFLDGSLY